MTGTLVAQPHVLQSRSRNGAEIHVAPLATTPLVRVHLALRIDTPTLPDLARAEVFQAHWLTTAKVTALQRLGGTVQVARSQHWLSFAAMAPSTLFQETIDTVCSAAASVQTSDDELRQATDRARRQARSTAARPAAISTELVTLAALGHVPPALSTQLTGPMWDALTAPDIVSFAPRHSTGSPAHLVICGDIPPDRTLELACTAMDPLPAGTHRPTPLFPGPVNGDGARQEHTRPGWSVAHLRYAYNGLHRSHPLFPASLLATAALGYFSGRINSRVRERLGLAYRTDASVGQYLDLDMVFVEADVAPDHADTADTEITSIVDNFTERGIEDAELEDVTSFVTGQYALALSSQTGLAASLLSYATSGLGVPEISGLPRAISGTTAAQVTEAARLVYGPGPAAHVVVRPAIPEEG
ncbi:pitrilysin family protein [Streptomyces sp. NBC_00078]|uniref:M16 family metallopeptidase n=1 Tax=unclassified Streptomyces TaxID=2593676 RepID=UPI002250D155|nr:insulinase family protein [Streptomyces sp. NBC_00078]MCX5421894.1 insulinase family protein [Streptomyces sp. NBC_00078]